MASRCTARRATLASSPPKRPASGATSTWTGHCSSRRSGASRYRSSSRRQTGRRDGRRVPDPSEGDLLQRVLEIGRTIPAGTVEVLCARLEQTGSAPPPQDIVGYIGDAAARESVRQLIV